MNTVDLVSRLTKALGPKGVLTDPADLAPHLTDWRNTFTGKTPCLVRPGSTAEVAKAVTICRDAGTPIVPQGGNTGLAAAAVPDASGRQVMMTLDRMTRIRDLDTVGLTIEVEAGCVLKVAQDAALDAGRMLPVSFAAEGSATIGGIVSTNAGGINVLRYGMTRSMVLGLEVVLPDGTIVSGLRRLRKNNAGYDWKQVFIGAEGTLGIVTAAVLRLVPRPRHITTALLAVDSATAAIDLLGLAQDELGDQISAFELMSARSLELVELHLGMKPPVGTANWYVLIEAASSLAGLREATEGMLALAFERGIANDGVIAESEAQAAGLWSLREHVTQAEARSGPSAKHDVSVPVNLIPRFLTAAYEALAHEEPPPQVNAFGHLGDGNIHYNVLIQPAHDIARINRIVHDVVASFGGSISAEHGIGQYRVAELAHYLPPEELALAHRLKQAIDPAGLMNPGKIFARDGK